MEPITLCGLAIVMFGFWLEFGPVLKAVVKKSRAGLSHSGWFSKSAIRGAVPLGKLPQHIGRRSSKGARLAAFSGSMARL